MHILNYKLKRIIDKTYRPFNVLPRADKTKARAYKNPDSSFPPSNNEK